MIHPTTSTWLHALDASSSAWRGALDGLYGSAGMPEASRTMLRDALTRFNERFGETNVRVFRAPGRVNLRGMHVDTHGGYLNLMSHQREVLMVCGPGTPGRYALINTDNDYAEAAFDTVALRETASRCARWEEFLNSPAARATVAPHGAWWHYVLGAALRAEYGAQGAPLFGVNACVAGNIPAGAALSSSAALCVAAYGAVNAMNGRAVSHADWILGARDAEWITGARTGTSDQAASVLCRPGEVCNVALLAEDFSLERLRRVAFPGGLRLLVINSCKRRSLSGAEQVAYSRNRFAYSMALEVFRREWLTLGGDDAAHLDRLSHIVTDDTSTLARVYAVLERVPSHVTLDALRERYELPALDAQYQRYFGASPEEARPTDFDLRGPLLYGISESERARRFADWLEHNDAEALGGAMFTGHDGDRVRTAVGGVHRRTVSIEDLRAARAAGTPISSLAGDYGASSPTLDALVDAARAGGALGACLTGAGIAGCVIALCRAEDEEHVRAAVLRCLKDRGLSDEQLADAVVSNAPPMGAGELPWPA